MRTIAWDVDDVLNDFMYSWHRYKWMPEHPDCAVTFDGITVNPPHELLGVDVEEYLASIDEFRLSNEFKTVSASEAVLKWFAEHGNKAHHIALTAVPSAVAPVSAGWVLKHFGSWIRSFHFVPSYRKTADDGDYDATKVDYIKRVGSVDVLVEDSAKNLAGLDAVGKQGLLVSQPWNRGGKSIEEVLEELTRIVEG